MIKYFDQYYVGRRQESDDVVLGFATPFENNKAFDKRKSTVDSWANASYQYYDAASRSYVKRPQIEPITVDNVPIEGFCISNSVKRSGWNGGNVVWRIDDPRGWQLEIPSANLAQIIDSVGIEAGGKIPGKCVFGRDGATNILIPENSQLWQQLASDQKKLDAKKMQRELKAVDLVIGRKYRLKNDDYGFYLGHLHAHNLDGDAASKDRYHVYYVETTVNNYTTKRLVARKSTFAIQEDYNTKDISMDDVAAYLTSPNSIDSVLKYGVKFFSDSAAPLVAVATPVSLTNMLDEGAYSSTLKVKPNYTVFESITPGGDVYTTFYKIYHSTGYMYSYKFSLSRASYLTNDNAHSRFNKTIDQITNACIIEIRQNNKKVYTI